MTASGTQNKREILDNIDSAIECLNLDPLAWLPIGAEHWEKAKSLLQQARRELDSDTV